MQLNPDQAAKLAGELLKVDTTDGSSTPGAPGPGGPLFALPILTADRAVAGYRVVRLVNVGGMGEVYEAEQESTRRRVALKLVRGNRLTPELRHRFEHEVRILASLQHPGIAQIYEAGEISVAAAQDGSPQRAPFFAMEFIEGEPLTKYAVRRVLGVRDRLELFLRVCSAVEYAHQKGVIHRDLKPANILVTAPAPQSAGSGPFQNELGAPKVLDFGIARAVDTDMTLTSIETEVGKLVGTLPYMSPEQTEGNSANLDTRSDIYALGVVLYELLSGRLPYELKGDAAARLASMVGMIKETEPAPLSSIDREFRGDLETIVGKSLEKDRDRRYQSVGEFAADIRRYLDDQPIEARRPSAWYELRKFARRNRGIVLSLSGASFFFLAGLVMAIALAVRELRHSSDLESASTAAREAAARATEREQAARLSADAAEGVLDFVTTAISSVEPGKGGDGMTVAALLESMTEELSQGSPSDPVSRAAIQSSIGSAHAAMRESAKAIPLLKAALAAQEEHLGVDSPTTLRTLHRLCQASLDQRLPGECRALAELMIERGQRVFGATSGYVIAARTALVQCLLAERRLAEARQAADTVLRDARAANGEGSKSGLVALTAAAQAAESMGDYQEAVRLWRRYLELEPDGKILGWRSTVIAKVQLAHAYHALGQVRQAEQLYREGFESQRDRQGRDSVETLITQVSFGVMLCRTGRREEGERLLREAADLHAARRGERNVHTLLSKAALGEALTDTDQLNESEALLRESLEGLAEIAPQRLREIRTARGSLASVLSKLGKHDEAVLMSGALLSESEAAHGAESAVTMRARNDHAVILVRAGMFEQAESTFRALLRSLLDRPDAPRPQLVATYVNLGTSQARQGKLDAAETSLKAAHDEAARTFPEGHPATIAAARELASLYTQWGREAEAKEWSARAQPTATPRQK